ncbi:FRAS1-related extracellular matrix protein 2a [Denticeps clupeoides]|nr:FRAS1-related extracellular matrix protein 2 [Denticeps clupeoides]
MATSCGLLALALCVAVVVAASARAPRTEPSEDAVIVANNGVRVPLGRSAFVDPANDLVVEVRPGDRCVVTVLDAGPLSRGPGRLVPEKFPCQFGPGDVRYAHFGARSPARDRVRLQLRYDTPTETVVIPFMLEVEVVFTQLEVLTRNLPLAVDEPHGVSGPVDEKVLGFTYDRGSQHCEVSPVAGVLPRYGKVVDRSKLARMMDCDEFLKSDVRYQHTFHHGSPGRDYVPMVVELFNSEGSMLKQEFFHITVRIRRGEENVPPKPSFAALMMMEVAQFVMTAITPDVLAAEDRETSPDELIFNITSPLAYEEGYIVSTDDRNLPITSFYQKDVLDLKIAYKPPALDSDVERIFQLELQVVDAEGGTSDPFAFVIVVKPMNTLAPVVTRNTGQLLYEGQSRSLSSPHNLEIGDEDDLGGVKIRVIDGLRHGHLTVLGSHETFFTAAELGAGAVIYQHDGSDTYSDNIIFRMTDGKNDVEFLFPITIVPVDDQPPIINANTGLVVFKHKMAAISPLMLSAADVDSEDSTIRFSVQPPVSPIGEVLLRQSEAPEDPSSWKFNAADEVYEKAVTEWQQKDITDGKLFYRHTGPHVFQAVTARLVFRVEDDNDPPNQSGESVFVVRVMPLDDVPPALFPGAALQMTVHEYQLTHFDRNVLRYTDLDSEDRDLKYTVTRPPTDTDENHPVAMGSIVLTERPETEVTEFTQAQINHHKIAYDPPDLELGVAAHVVQFHYTVEDASGNSVDGRFTILLRPVNNKPPEITNTGFAVSERGVHVITRAELDADDPDTSSTDVSFTLRQGPQHGDVQYASRGVQEGETFSLMDVSDGKISYVHNGDEVASDLFKVDVSDGVHVVTVAVKVMVKLIDDEAPTLSLPAGTVGSHMEVLENGVAEITSGVIQGRDEDTDDLRLTFIVEDAPALGQILVNGAPADKFTQADVINGLVMYTHTSGEVGPTPKQDHFNLTLTDMSDEWTVGGNQVKGVSIHVTVLPLDNQSPVVTVRPPFRVLEGEKSSISGHHISAKDLDTAAEDILCTVVLQPASGYLENISPAPGSERSRTGTAVSAFTIKDIKEGNVNYVQSIHKTVEPVEDRFAFRCSDGVNFSERHFLPIVIIPTNDEKPEMYAKEFVVMEGMSVVVDAPLLNGVDADVPAEELTFVITKPPRNGFLLNQMSSVSVPVTNFTLGQIKGASRIVYEHDDSETTDDNFNVTLTDGKFTVEGVVKIVVVPVDDETPRLLVNSGLEVDVGQTKEISGKVLKATDLDSEDRTLTYVVRYGPGHGLLQKATSEGTLQNVTVGMNFTQTEVDHGRILYVHRGKEGVRDLLKFDVTDGVNPLVDRYFYVTVGDADVVFPDVISKGVSLKEGGRVTLTTDLLSTSDLNSPDEQLVFTITRDPVRGHLESTDAMGMPVTSFTQLQLAGSKIFYIHTSDEEVKMDSFEFEVTDGYNPVFRTFRVSIVDVDNKKPVLTVHELTVTEGQSKIVTPFELTVEDQDTAEHLLKFTISQPPVHGKLLFNSSRPVTFFTKQDLNENLISYKHDGTESAEDSFSFTVTDGTHLDFYVFPDTVFETRQPQTMKISVVSVDNGIPQVTVNKGASTLKTLPNGHLGAPITRQVLKAEDSDSPAASLLFRVTGDAEHGRLVSLARGDESVSTFTQADIDDLKIFYVLRDGGNSTNDQFYFTVEDNGGNKAKQQQFRLRWACISLEKERYVVDEKAVALEVVLRRRGYLGETSFVSIGSRDDTAKEGQDFKGKSQKQVQFNPGQTRALWRVRLLPDGRYEQSETFQIVLSEPVMGVLEFPSAATVEIVDPDDEAVVFIPQDSFTVEEDVGELLVPVLRSGDASEELTVVCYTQQGSAAGTVPSTVLSFTDYISRPEDHSSVLHFDRDETEKHCRVMVIDDSLHEAEETFNVTLSFAVGGRVGAEYGTARIAIRPDRDDAPSFYFGDTEYHVDEGEGSVEVQVWRTGTDLSGAAAVTVRSRQTDRLSAEAGMDYVALSRNLNFAPGVGLQTFRVTILDDLGRPVLEGTERFELVLRMPSSGFLGEPSKVTVLINDSLSDLPKMQFAQALYSGEEGRGEISAVVLRGGDLSYASSVRCYTRQGSAQVVEDFEERPNTDASIITFLPGETEKSCVLKLVDDGLFEEEEELRLVLGTPKSPSAFGAALGPRNETRVRITDDVDRPVIKFGEAKFSVTEPKEAGQVTVVRIPLRRVGDASKVSVVRVHTKDGSAHSGEDYHPISQDVEFRRGDQQHLVEVEVLYDGVREMREAFTVHLKPDENMVAETQVTRAVVYIEETNSVADVTFPAPPRVVSLLHYDQARAAEDLHPPAGYPVVCVTACDQRFGDYGKTGSICTGERIDNALTRYRWLVSAPRGPDGVTSPMREVDFDTFFTSSKRITLDAVYFQAGSRVQCAARAVNADGDEGLELSSPTVSISTEEGMCQPRGVGTVGAEPFSAKLRYTGTTDPEHANVIKLTVTMPHIDGMLPIVSTRPLSNFDLTLSPDGTRVGNHRCSNLLDYGEVTTRYGFAAASARGPAGAAESLPYQYSAPLRGNSTLRFYRSLNLEACLWEFESYYDMSELLSDCGGTVGTDGQVLNLVQSYVTLRVPLHVSYVFHSPLGVGGWQHFDLQSELRLTFTYDTAILWQDGIGSPPQAVLQGALYPTSMRINKEGRLVVNFRTEARFRGLFVAAHPGVQSRGRKEDRIQKRSSSTSAVFSMDHPGLTFNLTLVRSEPSYNQPVQQWTFISDFAVRDYSGTYTVKLIPCTAAMHAEFTSPPVCNPREPVTFDLDIRFQQVSDPVAVEFSLNTQMFLLSKRSVWLSDGSMGFGQESDTAFSEGDTIYGRVMVDPVQNLGDSFHCNIEKVFLCTGTDGYVPKYDPTKFEFGCLADAPSLLYRFKIIDKAQPETQARAFGDVDFNAVLAVDDPSALVLVKQPGSDGFRLDSTAMFQVAAGREWYLHTIYTVRSRDNARRGIGRRSLEYHSVTPGGHQVRTRRAAGRVPAVAEDIGSSSDRGTNIMHVALDRSRRRADGGGEMYADGPAPHQLDSRAGEEASLAAAGVLAGVLLAVLLAVATARLSRSRGRRTARASGSMRPVMVVDQAGDGSEV